MHLVRSYAGFKFRRNLQSFVEFVTLGGVAVESQTRKLLKGKAHQSVFMMYMRKQACVYLKIILVCLELPLQANSNKCFKNTQKIVINK